MSWAHRIAVASSAAAAAATPPALATPSLLASVQTATGGTSGGDPTGTFNTTAGQLLIAFSITRASSHLTHIVPATTITAGNLHDFGGGVRWQQIGSQINSDNSTIYFQLSAWQARVVTGETGRTVAAAWSSGSSFRTGAYVVGVLEGWDPTTPILNAKTADQKGGSTSRSITLDSSPAASSKLVYAVAEHGADADGTPPTSFTEASDLNSGDFHMTLGFAAGAAGAGAHSWTNMQSSPVAACGLAFEVASA